MTFKVPHGALAWVCYLTGGLLQMFDKNKDGYISLEDLRMTMKLLGQSLTDEEAAAMLQVMDINRDGKISYTGK